MTTRYTMTTDNAKNRDSASVRIYKETAERVKKVRRKLISAENRDLSDIGLINEILEEGLAKRERKLGIS
jgi:hypothetical protein